MILPQKGAWGFFSMIWENRDVIVEVINKIQIVAKHVKNAIEDLKDDGKINGSNKES